MLQEKGDLILFLRIESIATARFRYLLLEKVNDGQARFIDDR